MITLMERIRSEAAELTAKMIQTRRDLHKIPELAFCEEKTADYICGRLKEIGLPFERGVAKTGVVALISAENASHTLLLRADMDALPMQESKKLPFASEHAGVMHACGHDGHVAILLAAAEILWKMREELSCNVKLVFQPAEEDTGGAKPMIDAGVLENPKVDAALALHIMNELDVGTIRVLDGAVMACPDEFDLKIIGKGGHGAYPDRCVDPIAIASQIITAFSVLSARCTNVYAPNVISVCSISGGTFYNVIPESVTMRGTVRLYDRELRARLPKMMEQVIKRYTEAFGAEYDWDYRFMFPPVVNDSALAESFAGCAEKILGAENVLRKGSPSMAGDDFSYFGERVPSVYFNLGGGSDRKGLREALHSPDFNFDEDCLLTGVLSLCCFAVHYGREAEMES